MPQQPEGMSVTLWPAGSSSIFTVGVSDDSAFWWQWPWSLMARGSALKAARVIRPASASRAMNSSISSAFFARALAASSR
jgi:hypothetical protein